MKNYLGLVPMRLLFMILLRNQQLNGTGLMGFLETSGNCQQYQNDGKSIKLTSRLICNKNIENEGISCPDYELRFCCPQNLEQNTSAIISLLGRSNHYSSYSESDFDEGNLTISYKLII